MSDLTVRVMAVAADLDGTCQSLHDVATEEEVNSLAFCQLLDEQVMLCEQCGWWTEAGDVNDDGVCSECRE